ncbi:MAG TPA: glycosyltransferase family 2 protein [Bacilli bacterium]|nr:glycosyltransferase family 2 protein [Bacilli bacterium]HPS18846.1 glycosyltransferase family 2 protein [Bacilli bacterium]
MAYTDVIVLIPSYEPDQEIINLVKELKNIGYPTIVVNDGSNNSFDSIFEFLKENSIVIGYDENKGKGAALKYGIEHIRNNEPNINYIITADGDGQHSCNDIDRVYQELKKTNDLVFGVRHFGKNVPFRSRFGNSFSKITRSLTTKEYIPDDQCGLRGFSRKYFGKMLEISGQKYEYEMNVLMLFQLRHYPIKYLKIETIYLNDNKSSHFSPFLDTFRIQCTIFSHSIISLTSLLLMVASFVLISSLTPLHPLLNFVISEFVGFQLLFAFVTVIYPTYKNGYRLLKELIFFFARLLFGFGVFSLLIIAFHFDDIGSAIIAFLLGESLNVIISYQITKYLKRTHN